jgi:predicted RNase H-like nuclease (RuvC/YqgF family)
MSRSEDSAGNPTQDPLLGLEHAVGRALHRIRDLESRLGEAERRAAELDHVLLDVSGGEQRPTVLLDRVNALEAENEELRGRLARGREGVERLLARIRFLEAQR